MIPLSDISVQGIQHITTQQLQQEAQRGNTIKLVATANFAAATGSGSGRPQCSVQPMVVSQDSFVGSITGWEMGIEVHSDIYGISSYKLYEKEPIPTAASMLRDAVHLVVTNRQ
jgi:homoserine dehydrogenase